MKKFLNQGISTPLAIGIIIGIAIIVAGAILAYQYFSKTQIPTPNDQSNTEIAGWKTYTNSEYGFKIEYPVVYNTKISNCFVYKKDGQKLNDAKSINIGDDDLLTVQICHFVGVASDFFQEDGFVSLNIDNRNSYKKEFEIKGGGRGWYYVQEDAFNVIFIDTFWAYSGEYPNTVADDKFRERKQTIDKIISTFKFTNPAVDLTAGWETYKNNTYGFEIKYPQDWVVDYDLLSHMNGGEGSVVFCPPELQNNGMNDLTGKNVNCIVDKTLGGSINPKAPIVLRQCDYYVKNTDCLKDSNTVKFFLNRNDGWGYNLLVVDTKYQNVFNQIISTFKFTK